MVEGDRLLLADGKTRATIIKDVGMGSFIIEVKEKELTGVKLVTADEIHEGILFTPFQSDYKKSLQKKKNDFHSPFLDSHIKEAK